MNNLSRPQRLILIGLAVIVAGVQFWLAVTNGIEGGSWIIALVVVAAALFFAFSSSGTDEPPNKSALDLFGPFVQKLGKKLPGPQSGYNDPMTKLLQADQITERVVPIAYGVLCIGRSEQDSAYLLSDEHRALFNLAVKTMVGPRIAAGRAMTNMMPIPGMGVGHSETELQGIFSLLLHEVLQQISNMGEMHPKESAQKNLAQWISKKHKLNEPECLKIVQSK